MMGQAQQQQHHQLAKINEDDDEARQEEEYEDGDGRVQLHEIPGDMRMQNPSRQG